MVILKPIPQALTALIPSLPGPLQPRPSVEKWGQAYYLRLRKSVEDALPWLLAGVREVTQGWPTPLLARLAPVSMCSICGRPRGHSTHEPFGECDGDGGAATPVERMIELVIEAIGRGSAMVLRPADEPYAQARARDARILALIEAEGLDLSMACARLGLDVRAAEQRRKVDPLWAGRCEIAWLRASSRVVARAHDQALTNPKAERTLLRVLAARDPRYKERVAVEVEEADIRRAPAWAALMGRVLEAVGVGHTCMECGGCQCRERLEALRDGR